VVSQFREPLNEEQQQARLEARLSVLDAYLLAAERRTEVMDAAAEARDADKARRSIAQLLDITENAADAILELRVGRFTRSEVAHIRAENHDIRGRLDRAR
jgi:DNA gyrase/topoisomerase IV subunit A